jgi:hypothetical protein
VAELVLEAESEPDVTAQAMFWSIRHSEAWAHFRSAAVVRLPPGSYLEALSMRDARSDRSPAGGSSSLVPAEDGARCAQVPVLLLNGSEDPQDSPRNVADTTGEFPNSLRIVAPLGLPGVVWIRIRLQALWLGDIGPA